MPHATVPSPGLQALILCGPGVSLNTFTSNPKDLSKALIPIANRPMVWYPMDWCHRMGVSDITLITPPECAPALESALATHPALTSLPSPKPQVVVPQGLENTTGTGELLRLPEVQKCITADFIVLPCDLFSELDGARIIQQWMTLNPAGTSAAKDIRKGGLTVFYSTAGWEDISHKKDETDFVATSPLSSAAVPPPPASLRSNIEELVWVMPTDTLNDKLEENASHLRIRNSLLEAHPRVKLRRKHRDAHIYVFPKWVKGFVARNDTFDAISEDVVGWWAKAGWQNGLAAKLGLDQILVKKKPMSESFEESMEEEEIDPMDSSSTKSSISPGRSSQFASRIKISDPAASSPISVPQLLAYVQPAPSPSAPQPLLRRVDTTQQLLSVSLYIAKQQPGYVLLPEHRIHPSASVGLQCRIAQEDSLIAENVQIGIRANIKETVIGPNCEIGNNVRLTKCLLMDGVHVGDGVQLTGCIVGRRAKILGLKPVEPPPTPGDGQPQVDGAAAPKAKAKKKAHDDDDERTRLTDCEVAPNFVVESGTDVKGEKLMAFDTEGMDEDEMDKD